MPKYEQELPYAAEVLENSYRDTDKQIPEEVQKKLAEIDKRDHISTKRPQ
ncbi:hypothetical protein [Virgibacillus sediminis]|uniref:Uncharacterized protein n=1 Tax=Virgibacillus sediminis TaxID=202260 RepID=A0ABV7A9W2_9BACI